MEQTVTEYLSHLNIPISESYCKKCILSHPDYPSLLSVADTLERLGIDHHVGQLEATSADQLPFPCIIHIDKRGGQLVLLKNQDDLDAHQSDLEAWDGVVLKAKAADSILDEEHNKQYDRENKRKTLSIVLGVALLGLLAVPVVQAASWLYLSLFATSVAGALVGYLLLAKDLGVTYEPVENFCNAGKKTNCDRILNAGDAQLFGFLTFTDAAASYFFFQLLIVGLFIPLFEDGESFLSILATASVLTIPVIGYSLYYQAVKANTWCRLCVVVDVILGLQAGLFALMYAGQMFGLSTVQILPVLLSAFLFSAVSSSVLLLKNRLKPAEQLRNEVISANRVKYDPEIFMQLLMRKEEIDTTPFSPEITLGNPEAPVQVLMVANLHCNPCRKAFNTAKKILTSYPEKVCFSLRLTKGMENTIDGMSASTYVIRYWQQFIQGRNDEKERAMNLFVDWYRQMEPESFAHQYSLRDGALKISETNSVELEAKHYNWVDQNEIRRTPTFYINGYKMPHNYHISDLMTMLPGIAVQSKVSFSVSRENTNEIV